MECGRTGLKIIAAVATSFIIYYKSMMIIPTMAVNRTISRLINTAATAHAIFFTQRAPFLIDTTAIMMCS
jgi:hypothetical protein